MSVSGPILCPVCGKKAKTGSAIDCARHMFGTGDQPHRKWVDEAVAPQGTSFIDLMIEQATKPGNSQLCPSRRSHPEGRRETEAEKAKK